jgi:hypothetical protein
MDATDAQTKMQAELARISAQRAQSALWSLQENTSQNEKYNRNQQAGKHIECLDFLDL